jgi:hypothetical protein
MLLSPFVNLTTPSRLMSTTPMSAAQPSAARRCSQPHACRCAGMLMGPPYHTPYHVIVSVRCWWH